MSRLSDGVQWLRRHAYFKIVLPALVAAGLLTYVADMASSSHSLHVLGLVLEHVWWIALLLTIPYLAARVYVWNHLMRELNLFIPMRRLLLAFAGGEMAKSFPAGVYVENYLLDRLTDFDKEQTARSTAATTAILGLESAIALTIVLVVGIPGDTWVRWVLVAVTVVWLILGAVAWLLIRRELHQGSQLPRWVRKLLTAADEFFKAGAALFQWRTLTNFVPTACYMAIYAADLYVIIHVMGFHLGWFAVVTTYAAMVLAIVLIPIPTEIGIAEISALGALEAFAAIASLALRILATGSTIVVAGVLFLALRDELKKADQKQ
jgi:uncharacterized membrane protein YbhN (UPF0104 family)